MREFSHKYVTFFLNMAEGGGGPSQADLKRKLVQLANEIF